MRGRASRRVDLELRMNGREGYICRQSRLAAPGAEGPLLLLFFIAAAITTPFWSHAAQRYGAKPSLMAAMILAILAFIWAAFLGQAAQAGTAVSA